MELSEYEDSIMIFCNDENLFEEEYIEAIETSIQENPELNWLIFCTDINFNNTNNKFKKNTNFFEYRFFHEVDLNDFKEENTSMETISKKIIENIYLKFKDILIIH